MNIQVINESKYEDGSFSALVKTYGCEYSVYKDTNGVERIYATGEYRLQKWQRSGQIKKIKEWLAAQ